MATIVRAILTTLGSIAKAGKVGQILATFPVSPIKPGELFLKDNTKTRNLDYNRRLSL